MDTGCNAIAPVDRAVKELPTVAVLAGSRGGRLVASSITIEGDLGGGGFNVKIARAAAREALRQAAAAKELQLQEKKARGGELKGMAFVKTAQPQQSNNRRGRGASSQCWDRKSASLFSGGTTAKSKVKHSAPKAGVREIMVVDSTVRHDTHIAREGGIENSSVATEESAHGDTLTGESASVAGKSCSGAFRKDPKGVVKKMRGLNKDSVAWSPSMRIPRPSPSMRGRENNGVGQGATIRQLVHMGIF